MASSDRLARPAIVAALAAALVAGCGRPAQMGADPEVFTTVDALYTAVSLREPSQVDRCAAALAGLREAGRLPDSAHGDLDRVISASRDGRWERAQSDLRRFMLGQRR